MSVGPGGGIMGLPGGETAASEPEDKKPPPPGLVVVDTFPADETPTPTRILRMADMDLFGELKDSGQYSGRENPFDLHFRKAAEAVKRGADSLSASVAAAELEPEDSLNTPKIYCGETPQPSSLPLPPLASRPVILKVQPSSCRLPMAYVPPVKTYKPIAPSPLPLAPSSPSSSALLLLKFPTGETVKLSNLPLGLTASPLGLTTAPPLQPDTRHRLRNSLNLGVRQRQEQEAVVEEERGEGCGKDGGEGGTREELKERNRMSAQRSRQRKRQQSDSLRAESEGVSRENDKLRVENSALQQRVNQLTAQLARHQDCSVTRREQGQGQVEGHPVFSHEELPSPREPPPPQTVPEDLTVHRLEKSPEPPPAKEPRLAPRITPAPSAVMKLLPAPNIRVLPAATARVLPAATARVVPAATVRVLSAAPAAARVHPAAARVLPAAARRVGPVLPPLSVKKTLARHCHKAVTKRSEEVESRAVTKGRLKDKLLVLKAKMAEEQGWASNNTS